MYALLSFPVGEFASIGACVGEQTRHIGDRGLLRGVEALIGLAGGLPGDLPAAVFVVMHLSEESPSVLPRILDRSGPLEAVRAEDGERVEKGRIYVAPPGYHMMVADGRVRVALGPK
jgi:two-component system chemotaxis response regulator CheB